MTVACVSLSVAFHGVCSAQPGLPEFRQASNDIRGWYYGMSDFVLVLGAIAGILGGAKVFTNWQSGKRNIDNEVIAWFLACLFLSMMGGIVRAFFL